MSLTGLTPSCLMCGKTTKVYASSGRVKEYCSRNCKSKHLGTRRTFQCQICGGTEVLGSRCVNYQCKVKLGVITNTPVPCIQCGKLFKKKSDRVGYCSRDCKGLSRRKKWPHTKVHPCTDCGRYVNARRKRCDECRATLLNSQKESSRSTGICRCRYCNKLWFATKSARKMRFCSSRCARRASGKSHRHRARKYGVPYEPINIAKLMERDGGRCVICRVRVVRSDAFNPKWATIGHIVPISKGGPHTWSNVQLECWKCNTHAGAKTHGQHRLF